jgi:hypothetical protein
MPNLVGIGLSQVPTNGMLGGLAYQDPEHASIKDLDLKNLSQINSEISDTAVDVFVYDTHRDSDGGAWRKRTQHTSWYNETLGTSTRGTRREFPSVAVIVIERQKIRIYDGDDPDLPMWMVFEINQYSNGGNLAYTPTGIGHVSSPPFNSVSLSSVHMLNGLLFIGGNRDTNSNSVHAGYDINFISEVMHEYLHYPVSATRTSKWKLYGNISQRNSTDVFQYPNSRYYASGTDGGFSNVVNDVTMTVLPNTPLDDATRLPVPTIAVGTRDGVSVIKDDGTVMSTASSSGGYHIEKVDFTDDHGLNAHIDSNTGGNKGLVYVNNINKLNGLSYSTYANWDGVLYANRYATNVLTYKTLGNGSAYPVSDFISMSGTDAAVGSNFTDGGLTLLAKNNESTGQGMVAFVASDFNTGYMQGDIKGAFLSDTDTTNATYTTVADDWATASAWTKQSSISVSSTGSGTSGTLSITGNGTGSNVYFFNGITVEANTDYVMTVTFGAENANEFYINNTTYSTANKLLDINALSGLTRGGHFNSGSNTFLYIQGYQVSSSATTITSLVIQKVSEKDRSVNNKGLQVFGTVTKSAVATGADLVSYGPFSNSSYLRQPYNSDLQWDGNSTWSISFWVYFTQNQAYDTLISREQSDGSGNRWSIQTGNQNTITFKSQGSSRVQVPGDSVHSQWRHICFTQGGGLYRAYRDGVEVGTYVGSDNFSNTSAELNIGYETAVGGAEQSKLALVRISNTYPSAEQIKKMYEDEKHLFQEDAKATLYGSSDAVTALGYDDSTNLLYAGTSAGRSEFQGLRRINNTTEAVTTAISAFNGLVAEQ